MLQSLIRPGSGDVLGRWGGFGPYYAMFPMDFAVSVIAIHSNPGDWVLDPFAGRGTAVFAASALKRVGLGIEIHPAGWLYGRVKLRPAPKGQVLSRLDEIAKCSRRSRAMPPSKFFEFCFSTPVYRFLATARASLQWRTCGVDSTLMAFLLVYLHAKLGAGLSNQMRQTKAMSPDYSIKWWKANGYSSPPDLDAAAFIKQRIEWRYKKGIPGYEDSRVVLGDSTLVIPRLRTPKFSLLFTSPPYRAVTNYHYDQWLRLWLLGGKSSPDAPRGGRSVHKGRFQCPLAYEALLRRVFGYSKRILEPKATIYVRTDARSSTSEITRKVLADVFADKRMRIVGRPFSGATQTALYGDKEEKPGETDIVLESR